MTGYVWTTSPFADFPSLIWVVLAESPAEAVDKLIGKLGAHGAFTDSQLGAMKSSLLGVSPQILDMSGDVGLLTLGHTSLQLQP